jgi:hypothetical protein
MFRISLVAREIRAPSASIGALKSDALSKNHPRHLNVRERGADCALEMDCARLADARRGAAWMTSRTKRHQWRILYVRKADKQISLAVAWSPIAEPTWVERRRAASAVLPASMCRAAAGDGSGVGRLRRRTTAVENAGRAPGGCDLPATAHHMCRRAVSSQHATAPEACASAFPEQNFVLMFRRWALERWRATRQALGSDRARGRVVNSGRARGPPRSSAPVTC